LCRRSQLWNSRLQRKHVVGPAYGLCFGALRWGPLSGPFRIITILSCELLLGKGLGGSDLLSTTTAED
jgi:hypothetical protein